jgi:thiamine biosynthesis lipoprotein
MAVSTLAAPARRGWLRYRTPVWSTGAELVVTEPGCLFAAVDVLRQEIARTDRLANRFHPGSEISRVNAGAGGPVPVSDAFLRLLSEAFRVARATGGAVDPTIGAALVRLGYDRDIAQLASLAPDRLPEPRAVPGWRSVHVDEAAGTVELPPGAALDLGATAKARTADAVVDRVLERCDCGVAVSLGGDVAVGGPMPSGGFPVGLGDRWDTASPDEVVGIHGGGVATSGTSVRRWRVGEHDVHHVVDPQTGLPAVTPWRTVTVTVASCVDANAASTAALVKGDAAVPWLTALGFAARLVGADGLVTLVGDWPAGPIPSKGP